jgi:uncharacterized protein
MSNSLSLDSSHSNARISAIDALRGFTLLGIFITHMVEQYYAGQPPEKYAGQTTATIYDMIASGFSSILIMGKFYAIFSFLFGLSFYIQLSKAKTDLSFVLKFVWRLMILFAIGFLHHLHYRGDILTIYAMLGFVLLLSYRLPDKYLLGLSLLLIFDIPGIITRVAGLVGNDPSVTAFMKPDQSKLVAAYETLKSGTYLEYIKVNLESFKIKMDFQVWSGRIYMTPGLFLLGLYAGRKKMFEEIGSHLTEMRKIRKIAAWGLLGTIIIAVLFFVLANALTGGLTNDANMLAGLSFFNVFNTFLATVYVTWFVLLFQKDKWKARLLHFYSAGRMGLTTYLMQSCFGILIFSTLGFGLLGELGAAICFALAIVLFLFQIWISKVWMTYFNYGPVEWVWRSLTNFKIQPLMKSRVAKPMVALE